MADYIDFRDHVVETLRRLGVIADDSFDLKTCFDTLVTRYELLMQFREVAKGRSYRIVERANELRRDLNGIKSLAYGIPWEASSTEESKENASTATRTLNTVG